jgi:predicted PurR-regulated permease PerM
MSLDHKESANSTWDAPTRRIFAVVLGAAVLGTILLTRYIWLELLLATALVFFLSPLIVKLQESLRFPRGLAILCAYLLALVLFIIILFFIPAFFASFIQLGEGITIAIESAIDWLLQALESAETITILGIEIDLSAATEPLEAVLSSLETAVSERSVGDLLRAMGGVFSNFGRTTVTLLTALIAIAWTLFLAYIYALYISADDGKMRQSFINTIPPVYRQELTTLGERIRFVWRTYVHGQLMVMLAVGTLVTVVAWLLGLASPLALGVIAGLLEIVPYFGPVLATIPAVISALVYGSSRFDINNAAFAVIVIIAYVLIQQVEDLYLTPRIHGKSSKLPPLVVMISIMVAAHLAGLIGAIVVIPIVATGREIFSYLYAKIQKLDPYPELNTERTQSE